MKPYNQQQETKKTEIKFNLSERGGFSIQIQNPEALSEETLTMVQQMLDQANVYQQKEQISKEREIEAKLKIDGVVICFIGCMFAFTFFLSNVCISSISNWVQTSTVTKTN